jgi:cbb3-type cytochrome oxidase subunit 3
MDVIIAAFGGAAVFAVVIILLLIGLLVLVILLWRRRKQIDNAKVSFVRCAPDCFSVGCVVVSFVSLTTTIQCLLRC